MASAQPLGGSSRAGRILGPCLDKIIKNAAWRKHSNLVAACKAALDRLDAVTDSDDSPASPLIGLSSSDADTVLYPLTLAVDAASAKVAEPALDCVQKLFSLGLIRGEIDHRSEGEDRRLHAASRLVGSICGCGGLGEDAIELAMLRVLIAVVRSPVVVIRGECLAQIVKSCYNVYLGSQSGANQLCAKLVLAQILTIMYARVEVDAMEVRVRTVSIADMLDLSDKNLNDSSLAQAAQNFINEAMMEGSESDVLPPMVQKVDGEVNGGVDSGELSKIREDGLFLFKNLCKLSMKSSPENPEDPLLLRGKVLSLELLKMVIDSAGSLWRTNERQV